MAASSGLTTSVEGEDHHYLSRVLRYRVGDEFAALDPDGRPVVCSIREIGRSSLLLDVQYETSVAEPRGHPNRLEITLIVALLKGRKMDLVVRQATECGVSRIIPLRSRHSVSELVDERVATRTDRWQRIARAAQQQSGSLGHAKIEEPIDTDTMTSSVARGEGFVFHEQRLETSENLGTLSLASDRVTLAIGPEGGFADEEVRRFLSEGFTGVHLGDRVLRSETAVVYAIGAINVLHRRGTELTANQ